MSGFCVWFLVVLFVGCGVCCIGYGVVGGVVVGCFVFGLRFGYYGVIVLVCV